MRVTPVGKLVLAVAFIVVFVVGLKTAMNNGLIPTPGILKSVVASKTGDLSNQQDAQSGATLKLPFPSTRPANLATPLFNWVGWEWNGQLAAFLAMGGQSTTVGSQMARFGVNTTFTMTPSNDVMKQGVFKCAKLLSEGQVCDGDAYAGFVAMGDGSGYWLADMNKQLETAFKSKDYNVRIIDAIGRSNGEDALLGPAEWKTNPKSMLGKTVVGVILDGDWNIALAYEGFNGLKNNPDIHTYDPTAVNWISAPDNDYIKAVTEVYIPNKCETRKVVIDGKPAQVDGKSEVQVCPDGVVTWTPGDEQAVHGRAGTAKIISSHEYSAQMPTTLYVINKFAKQNPDTINGFIEATWVAADQIKSYDDALHFAANLEAKLYKDQDGAYWYKYFKGTKDHGQPLGGSAVFNEEDTLRFFGLKDGFQNNMKSTYETFARIDVEQYPAQFAKAPIPAYKDAVDTTYIRNAQDKLSNEGVTSGEAEKQDYTAATSDAGTVVGNAPQYISFNTNSAEPTSQGIETLKKLASSLGIAKSLAFEIDGYTDNSGSDAVNIPLSKARANAVKVYLQKNYPSDFPESRFKTVQGFGSQKPLSPNDTPANKALNRRVEIIQLSSDY